ncbi:MAG: response regulator transcription factor [Gemmatimonadaceae bacterium]|nr:response regulator transcription factor [Gemmatimonadaceae bacterium]
MSGSTSTPLATILVIEDNALMAAGIRSNLEFEGYTVLLADTGEEGLRLALEAKPSLVILDVMLPDTDGFRVLRELRERGHNVPVLMLTALGEEADKVRGFRFGADDYVTKPFGLMELLARVAALLRRAQRDSTPVASEQHQFGSVQVDIATRTVTRRGAEVALRPREFDLLAALLRRRGSLLSRDTLLREVWGYGDQVVSRTVDTHLAELRRKLEDDPAAPQWLLTVRKAGYRLAMATASGAPMAEASDDSLDGAQDADADAAAAAAAARRTPAARERP